MDFKFENDRKMKIKFLVTHNNGDNNRHNYWNSLNYFSVKK